MPIPDFQSIMLPLLQYCGDQKDHTNRETRDHLAKVFSLTEEERKELLPSGQQATFDNRVAWARAHMKMAGFLENSKRAVFRITEKGINILKDNPSNINLKFLQQIPEYIEAKNKNKQIKTDEIKPNEKQHQTPEEQLEDAYQYIRETLISEIIQKLQETPPDFFEKIVVEVLVKMGYGGSRKDAGKAIGRSGDGGIDGIIKEDRLGLDIIYLQAKRWQGTIGRPEIQKFAGALQGQRARKGIFITTADFTKDAREYAAMIENKIVLIDGKQLAQYMIDNNVGVTMVAIYEIKKLDSDYFLDD